MQRTVTAYRVMGLSAGFVLAGMAGPGADSSAMGQTIDIGGKTYTVERLGGSDSMTNGDFTQPVFITQANGDDNNLYIAERVDSDLSSIGRIVRFDQTTQTQSTFLDLGGVTSGEGGLLHVSFHPDYQTNGKLYVTYVAGSTNYVEEYQSANPSDPTVAPTFSRRLLQYDALTTGNIAHTVNWTGFQPGGDTNALYVTTGDGGAQYPSTEFVPATIESNDTPYSKLLRIDLNADFTTPTGSGLETDDRIDVVAKGLRNPYRVSFDESGGMFIGDVGFHAVEEIDYISAAQIASVDIEDFGWTEREGTAETTPSAVGGPGSPGDINPIWDYEHVGQDDEPIVAKGPDFHGASVTGGYVFDGRYFYGDFTNSKIYSGLFDTSLDPSLFDGNNLTDLELHLDDLQAATGVTLHSLVSFGMDNQGNLYIIDFGTGQGFFPSVGTGEIFRILAPVPEPASITLLACGACGVLMRRRSRCR